MSDTAQIGMNDSPTVTDQPTRRTAVPAGACTGCGTIRQQHIACTTVDCPRFVPIHLRTPDDHKVHR